MSQDRGRTRERITTTIEPELNRALRRYAGVTGQPIGRALDEFLPVEFLDTLSDLILQAKRGEVTQQEAASTLAQAMQRHLAGMLTPQEQNELFHQIGR